MTGPIEGRVRDLAAGGDAVVQTEAGVVLAAGAAPGERVRLHRLRRARGVLRGELGAVLEGSPDRVAPPCDHAGACGGCPWMHLSEEAQARPRRRFVETALARAGHEVALVVHPAPAHLGYRRRARLAWSGGQLGYRRRRSRTVEPVDSCMVLEPRLQGVLARLARELAPAFRGTGQVLLAASGHGVAVVVRADGAQPPEAFSTAAAWAQAPEVTGVSLTTPDSPAAAVWGDPRDVLDGPDARPVYAAPGGFSQGNRAVNALLVQRVAALAETTAARVTELYAGCGNLTVALAPGSGPYVAVESDPAAVGACRGNLRARGLDHVRVVQADAASALRRGACDVLVLDPPRAGARDALTAGVRRRPRRIVYVSCDMATLQRDLAALASAGYRADAAEAFDMFPQTAHVEACVRLVRAR